MIYDVKIIKPNNEIFWNADKTYSHSAISSNGKFKVELKNPPIKENGYIFSMEMQCVGKYNNKHRYMIKGLCEKVDDEPIFKITELK